MGKVLIRKVFSDAYFGRISSLQAGQIIHLFCNEEGLNPAIKAPVTILMTTEKGKFQLSLYESFLTQMNWIIAKLSAQLITVDLAVDEFYLGIEHLHHEMKGQDENHGIEYQSYLKIQPCPVCSFLATRIAES